MFLTLSFTNSTIRRGKTGSTEVLATDAGLETGKDYVQKDEQENDDRHS